MPSNLDDPNFWKLMRTPKRETPMSKGMTWEDIVNEYGDKEAKPAVKKIGYLDIVPISKLDMGHIAAKNLGFREMTNFYFNPEHWELATSGYQMHDILWEGTDGLVYISPEARFIVNTINKNKIRAIDIMRPDVWKKYFQDKFGPMP